LTFNCVMAQGCTALCGVGMPAWFPLGLVLIGRLSHEVGGSRVGNGKGMHEGEKLVCVAGLSCCPRRRERWKRGWNQGRARPTDQCLNRTLRKT
jgi:hypothetical protein